MTEVSGETGKERPQKSRSPSRGILRIPIATRIVLSFLLVILVSSGIFTIVGVRLIGDRVVAEAQEKVQHDLNSARVIFQGKLQHINDVVRLTADRFIIINAMTSGKILDAAAELKRLKTQEGLDILTITDATGKVILRANPSAPIGEDREQDEFVASVISQKEPVASAAIIAGSELLLEDSGLAEQAYFHFIDTPMARVRPEEEETSGMILEAAAPIFDYHNNFIGVVYGGVLLNRNYQIVDEIKQTVFQGLQYKGQDIGTATIFQDDVRIATNVKNRDGSRAVGTRVMKEVYDQVVVNDKPYIGRAYVVNNWYITAYEPIKNLSGRIIGILYVGILEQKYVDIRQQTIFIFLAITLSGAVISMLLAYFISQRISVPIQKLAAASQEVASGNLDTNVEIKTSDELGQLATSFNTMAKALKERDEKLKEYTTSKIMESERLAIIGQLAAGVAHELNNPLQGIVTYSHLLLETMPNEEWARGNLEKIVTQANRCRDIVRGLLDFSRQRKIEKRLYDVNIVLKECVALLENQAIFHNIQIITKLDPRLPMVVFDPSQVERVFMNIIINGAEAMDGQGKMTLETGLTPEHDFVEVKFTDTGPGITKENLKKIFSPFFTTKDPGHGTGLGLAISYGIIKEHKGTISVESKVGKGTTFIVRLPVTPAETENSSEKQA